MVSKLLQPTAERDGHAPQRGQAPSPRKPPWRSRRSLFAVVALLLAVVTVLTLVARGAAPGAVVAPAPTTAALTAHGEIQPSQRARVGTQGGGILRQLNVSPGFQVTEGADVARIEGPAGTEVVTAPFRGSVTNVLVHVGDTLLPGAVIAVVADLRTFQVETSDVDQFLVGHVQVGQQVQVTVDALDNLALPGTVKSVSGLPQADASGGQNYPVVISLSTIPPEARAGMSVRVTFPE